MKDEDSILTPEQIKAARKIINQTRRQKDRAARAAKANLWAAMNGPINDDLIAGREAEAAAFAEVAKLWAVREQCRIGHDVAIRAHMKARQIALMKREERQRAWKTWLKKRDDDRAAQQRRQRQISTGSAPIAPAIVPDDPLA